MRSPRVPAGFVGLAAAGLVFFAAGLTFLTGARLAFLTGTGLVARTGTYWPAVAPPLEPVEAAEVGATAPPLAALAAGANAAIESAQAVTRAVFIPQCFDRRRESLN